ncbi:4-(cytidine 5'-diphospho)-2-C-methyl-D-erythritol kinase [Chitinimonas sp. BJB300]|nr:4-(cytidine 5'-diphospho)-2-C-methyl-D-erythritol kinase [Chitinimonas sp. BJB300]PHV12724.1 4-(cytidine 5'-diphospho)-2-C-methyl-D-erythritol kinase [Chitinimonas sp. BJB300]TSJ90904.1 4-(cytidine 5'-diphospho)-2-C-methyl-D-erythritol kinase [Chitinimonas sp. BJB300]
MTVFHSFPAPAKLNLFLHVTGRRPDGYHLLQTVFRLIDFGDTIEIADDDNGKITHENPLPGVPAETDLMVRAARLLQEHTGSTRGCRLRITKRLPMGGGLGGGSSDAATVLMALNHRWRLGLNRAALQALGLRLGADVPLFIFGRDAFAEGIGEALKEISLPQQWYVVLTPPVSIPTIEIFSDPCLTRNTPPIIMAAFPNNRVRNDLEAVVRKRYPIVEKYLNWLSQFGNSAMTGSGACVFSAFDTHDEAMRVLSLLPPTMQGFSAQSIKQHPLFNLAD